MEPVFVQSPGLKVVMPATARDAKGLLLEAIRDPDPVIFLEPLRGYRTIKEDVPEGDFTVPFGELRVAREGNDVTLVSWSASIPVVEAAAERLAEEGISAHVVDLRTLVRSMRADWSRPWSAPAVVSSCTKHRPPRVSGRKSSPCCKSKHFILWEAPVRRVTAPDAPYPLPGVEMHYVPSVEKVLKAVHETLAD